ncbi:MAG: repeat-containing protein [Gemmatimonadetes bacterium]|nr:repeat-containing protein [Gemmatimonadota bacterium]
MMSTLRTPLAVAALSIAPLFAHAQASAARPSTPMQEASQLDSQGKTKEARVIFQRLINEAPDAAAKAAARRAMAMSYAFDGDCANTAKYEEMVIDYWKTREQAEPQNAFYQQGEMANEAARICIDVGALDVAEKLYRRGSELGLKEPDPKTHPQSLWDYRLAHALARLSARRGNAAGAQRHVAEARRILDSDSTMARAQERFFPYLTGYVALYTNNLKTAEAELNRALAIQGNQNDAFMHLLLAMTYEKLGDADKAKALYEKSYSLATGHNPPAAFARPYAFKKIWASVDSK